MKYLNAHIIERILSILIAALVLTGVGILFYFLSLRLGDVARENQAYNRYIACVLSVSPTDRDSDKIDHCWIEAQQDTGVEVKRYDR